MEEKSRPAPYPIRMPEELRQKLEESAHIGNRSLHAEIISRLESTFIDREHVEPGSVEAAIVELQAKFADLHKRVERMKPNK